MIKCSSIPTLGTIGLPPKVMSSLWDENPVTSVSIKYVKLGKISYVKLQPTFNTFFKVEQVKMVLEDNLKFHSTLTLGDIITVWYRGKAHPLKVIEMKPCEKGILLDTDVEVDLDNSLENKRIMDEEAASEEALSKGDSDNGYKLGGYKLSSSSTIRSNKEAESSISPHGAPEPVQITPALPLEPELDAEDVVSIRVRTLAGNTINRRFYRKQPFIHLFEFASVEMKVEKKVLQLSTRFPNRVFTVSEIEPSNVSFFEAGITASQEMFLASLIV